MKTRRLIIEFTPANEWQDELHWSMMVKFIKSWKEWCIDNNYAKEVRSFKSGNKRNKVHVTEETEEVKNAK